MDEYGPSGDAVDAGEVLAATATVPKHVVYRRFETETVILNLRTGQYHGVNHTGGRLIELLEEADGSIREAIDRLAAEYGQDTADIEQGLAEFCAALASRGLIELDGTG